MAALALRSCAKCGGPFQPHSHDAKLGFAIYCSRACYRLARRKLRDCARCGKSFLPRACRATAGTGQFCSRACVKPPATERFELKVDEEGPTPAHCPEIGPCHVWTAATNLHGYGVFRFEGKDELAHRVRWRFAEGRWPEPCALHRCDNRICVRRSHLFEGDRADNAADMMAKGRNGQPRGEDHPRAKLSASDVLAIRSAIAGGDSRRAIGARFGIGVTHVGHIARNKVWKSLGSGRVIAAMEEKTA